MEESDNLEEGDNSDETLVQLVATHQSALRGFVMAMMPGSADVDDVVQEVNALVWRKRREFEIGTNFNAWMLTVAKFHVLNAWRRQRNRRESAFPEDVLAKLVDQAIESSTAAPPSRHKILWECLERLRPTDRALILRRYFDDSSIKQLAAEAGRGVDSVKMSLYRIRNVLATCVRRRILQQRSLS
ncbi:sigma-70 family RNA polymerase sigma factor [Haloferula sp. A504]|uniref:sigma-70 family RNA polymerase sigma factor n=1 Tax=Haloferula sp. A504 TaxID=3373601 RepID=UPI0031CA90CD|nr:sigma-70 family RNA polymerase sigma factor [Verrucomicrobiaceae bacterium E54]